MQSELRKRLLSRTIDSSAAAWIERLSCQIEFARRFGELFPDRRVAWTRLVDAAEKRAEGLELAQVQDQVRAIETDLAEIGAEAKKFAVHCVGHGHIDMNWMWSWPETVATTRDTFASVLSFMRQYPDFTYSQSQVAVYELIKKYDLPMFEEIRQRVAEGRWEVTAMHWVEGDKNIVHGESIARHLLLSRRWIEREFGLKPEDVPVDWEPDTFGHANTIPNFLAQAAAKYYYCCRAGGGFEHPRVGEERPPLFWWKGTDGSQVLVYKETTWYNSDVNIGRNIALPMVEFCRETGVRDWMNVYGVGNHGGGPTRTEIELYLSMRDWPIYPRVEFGTARKWFEKVETEATDLPEIAHELNFEFTGCYTSQSLIKQANRYGERYCLDAEALLAIAPSPDAAQVAELLAERDRSSTPQPPPSKEGELLRTAWTHVLFNQFHDILPGSGVRQTREHALALFQEVGAITGMIKRRVGEALAASLNTAALLPDTPEGALERERLREGKVNAPYVAGAGILAGQTGHSQGSSGGVRFRPFVIWNPCSWERTEFVKLDLYDMDLDPDRMVARDEEGRQWPTVFLEKGNDWAHERVTVLFPARVPALGYRTYLFCEGEVTAEVPGVTAESETAFVAGDWRFELDRFSPGLKSVVHDPTDTAWINHYDTIGNWKHTVETPRGMTSWTLGKQSDPSDEPMASFQLHGISRNMATGVVQRTPAALVATHRSKPFGNGSSYAVKSLIHGFSPSVHVEADVDWREIGSEEKGIPGLVIDFDCEIDAEKTGYETPFGTVEREQGYKLDDVPSLRFSHWWIVPEDTDLKPHGMTLLQDCKFGHCRNFEAFFLRVVRSSFDPDHAPEVAKSSFRYGVHFHTEKPAPADLVRLGTAFNHPFIVFPANLQEGTGELSKSFAEVLTPGVVLTALKTAEDAGGLMLRLVEYNGVSTEAQVRLHADLLKNRTTAELCDLIERPTGATAKLENGLLTVTVPANSFVTVKLR